MKLPYHGWAVALLLLLAAALAWVWWAGRHQRAADMRLRTLLAQRVSAAAGTSCAETGTLARVILALGQSNAGNHGAPPRQALALELLSNSGQCSQMPAPLAGATGTGDSVWPRVDRLIKQSAAQPVSLRWSVLALDASSIEDWTRASSPLRQALTEQLAMLRSRGLEPELVLWQQGEADARAHTSQAQYRDGLQQLAAILASENIKAPVLLAKSTVCRSAPDAGIRRAIDDAIARSPARFRLGPDTDVLNTPSLRHDGCHFSAEGLERAAQLWALRINPLLQGMPP